MYQLKDTMQLLGRGGGGDIEVTQMAHQRQQMFNEQRQWFSPRALQ